MRNRVVFVLAACVFWAPGSRAAAPLGSVRHVSPQVVYGQDDRLEYSAVSPAWQHVADAVCVLVERSELTFNGDGTVTLHTIPYATSFYPPLCDDEPFRSEPTLGECTAFLAAPDRVVTTGHCVESDELNEIAFVFGFAITDPSQPAPLVVPESDVYFPAAVVARSFHDAPDYSDYTVVRLDRPVTGRDPLAIRRIGTPDVGTPVVLVGYPFGLPLKVAGNANVKRVTSRFFEANTDSYVGNSGSPVVNANTLSVEGMLYFGKSDYALDTVIVDTPAADTTYCIRSRVLPDDYGSYEGSIMTRDFARFIPDTTTSLQVSLLASGAMFDHVDLQWSTAGSWLPGAELDRRGELDDWRQLADVLPDDAGRFAYEDRAVISGSSYGYRLTWTDASAIQHSAEAWVAVPLDLQLSLAGARPNPAHARDLQVSLSLPSTAPGALSLYDIGGRRVAEADIGGLSPGAHLVRLDPDRAVRSGVYWLRLSQGARSASRIVVILD
jgi:hypothetical protein